MQTFVPGSVRCRLDPVRDASSVLLGTMHEDVDLTGRQAPVKDNGARATASS